MYIQGLSGSSGDCSIYSLSLLSGILPNVYYLHYCALVCAIAMLVPGSEADLDMASVLLNPQFADVTRM